MNIAELFIAASLFLYISASAHKELRSNSYYWQSSSKKQSAISQLESLSLELCNLTSRNAKIKLSKNKINLTCSKTPKKPELELGFISWTCKTTKAIAATQEHIIICPEY